MLNCVMLKPWREWNETFSVLQSGATSLYMSQVPKNNIYWDFLKIMEFFIAFFILKNDHLYLSHGYC